MAYVTEKRGLFYAVIYGKAGTPCRAESAADGTAARTGPTPSNWPTTSPNSVPAATAPDPR